MTRQDKTETLYMYTCLGIPVTSTNKSKDVIVNHIDASGNEIYDWLRQSKWMDAGAGGLEARHGRTLGGCRWRDAGRGQRLAPLHGNPPLMVPGVGRLAPWGLPSLSCSALRAGEREA